MFGGALRRAGPGSSISFTASLLVLYAGRGDRRCLAAGRGLWHLCRQRAENGFPDRRGPRCRRDGSRPLAPAPALTVIPIAETIEELRLPRGLLSAFGLGQGLVIILLSWFPSRAPVKGAVAPPSPHRRKGRGRRGIDYLPAQVLRQPMFWLMYLIFVLVASGGLMAAAQIGPIAGDYGIAEVPLSIAGLVLPALTLAISLDPHPSMVSGARSSAGSPTPSARENTMLHRVWA